MGYLGYSLTAHFGDGQSPHVKEGGWIGLVGSLVIAAAGVFALSAFTSAHRRLDLPTATADTARMRAAGGLARLSR